MRKKYKNLDIYFSRFVRSKSIKILSLYYYILMGKVKEHQGKNVLDKVLGKIKETFGIENFGNIKILIDTEDKLPDDITLKILR